MRFINGFDYFIVHTGSIIYSDYSNHTLSLNFIVLSADARGPWWWLVARQKWKLKNYFSREWRSVPFLFVRKKTGKYVFMWNTLSLDVGNGNGWLL